jgi:hypothetical protein
MWEESWREEGRKASISEINPQPTAYQTLKWRTVCSNLWLFIIQEEGVMDGSTRNGGACYLNMASRV